MDWNSDPLTSQSINFVVHWQAILALLCCTKMSTHEEANDGLGVASAPARKI